MIDPPVRPVGDPERQQELKLAVDYTVQLLV
ncbi:hypothetical protein C8J38_1313 [Rhizobium sp. PP-WC-2G-219]|nr:hypothetical protein DFI02_1532 [Rhizobium sp. PP-F2F-G20b]TCL87298.1 hypothetical protein C8J38_1313 [Rhizobium sp. PP-WC-2G-219]TCP75003.1 hypothetical protein C8J31_1356 [Rhizobium sp. PP-CC-2G-626]TCQ02785.1 hypothetical protein C8J34_1153 [Rhizobium sp. PP-F2F-G36]TCQ12747.1 hypothetical protein C8J33_1611 [Rhizobium sp. PP-CC-3G-465]